MGLRQRPRTIVNPASPVKRPSVGMEKYATRAKGFKALARLGSDVAEYFSDDDTGKAPPYSKDFYNFAITHFKGLSNEERMRPQSFVQFTRDINWQDYMDGTEGRGGIPEDDFEKAKKYILERGPRPDAHKIKWDFARRRAQEPGKFPTLKQHINEGAGGLNIYNDFSEDERKQLGYMRNASNATQELMDMTAKASTIDSLMFHRNRFRKDIAKRYGKPYDKKGLLKKDALYLMQLADNFVSTSVAQYNMKNQRDLDKAKNDVIKDSFPKIPPSTDKKAEITLSTNKTRYETKIGTLAESMKSGTVSYIDALNDLGSLNEAGRGAVPPKTLIEQTDKFMNEVHRIRNMVIPQPKKLGPGFTTDLEKGDLRDLSTHAFSNSFMADAYVRAMNDPEMRQIYIGGTEIGAQTAMAQKMRFRDNDTQLNPMQVATDFYDQAEAMSLLGITGKEYSRTIFGDRKAQTEFAEKLYREANDPKNRRKLEVRGRYGEINNILKNMGFTPKPIKQSNKEFEKKWYEIWK